MMSTSLAHGADIASRHARLALALDEGLALPDGPVLVLRLRAGERLDPLEHARIHVVQGFRPDHDALIGSGYSVSVVPKAAPSALVCLPRAKAAALDLIAQAADIEGCKLVMVDGQKTDGIDSVLTAIRATVPVDGVVSKAHGKLFWFDPRGQDISALRAPARSVEDPALGRFETGAGVFSADGVDPGSALLAAHLPDSLPAVMADLGAGWGYLSAAVLRRAGVQTLHLVEADHDALQAAKHNLADPRAEFHWADACTVTLPTRMGGIVMNPPFHTGRSARPELGLAFIRAAARLLQPKGQLWLVGNRHLPYGRALDSGFTTVQVLAQSGGFVVWHASGPKSSARSMPGSSAPAHRHRTR